MTGWTWIGGIVASVVVAGITAWFTGRIQTARLRAELQLEHSIEAAIRHLLESPSYKKRSLKKIKRHIRGFRDDDDPRFALLRAGPVAFSGEGGDEMWGLLSRNGEDIR